MTAKSNSLTVENARVEELQSSGNIRSLVAGEKFVELKESIRANGILVPLLGHYESTKKLVDDGNHRLEIARSLGIETVPVIFSNNTPTPAELLTLQLVANSLRFNLKPMERARAIERLMQESGWSASDVSTRIGEQSESMISKLLTLLVHPKEVQDLIDTGRVPMSSAYAIATVPNSEERERLINEVVNGRLTRDRLVAEIKAGRCMNRKPQSRKRANPRRACVTVPLGKGQWIKVRGQNLTLKVFVEWLEASLNRFRVLEPRDMELGDAFGIVSAGNP